MPRAAPFAPHAPAVPPAPAGAPRNETSNGFAIALMVGAMVVFAIDDAMLKLASQVPGDAASSGQVLMFHGMVASVVFGALMWRRGDRFTRALLTDRLVVWRSVSDIAAAAGFVTALTMMELSNASAILQVQPLVVTLGAAFFLGEAVGWRRWSAIAVGFAGVLVIIRPGLEGFTPVSWLVLIGVAGIAVRDLVTRLIDPAYSTMAISTLVSLALIPSGLVLHLAMGGGPVPNEEALLYLGIGSVFGVAGYYAITLATRVGEASTIAPYRYTRLVAAIALGWAVFGERPDTPMLLGSALVIGAGIYAFARERKRAAAMPVGTASAVGSPPVPAGTSALTPAPLGASPRTDPATPTGDPL